MLSSVTHLAFKTVEKDRGVRILLNRDKRKHFNVSDWSLQEHSVLTVII